MHSIVVAALASLLVLMPLVVCGQGFTAVEVADDGAAIKMGSSLDTTLYRSSANTLRTSGRLEVAGTMDVTGATTVTGSVSVGTTLSVSGTSTLTGTVTAQNLMTSAGPFTATQSFTTTGVAYLNGGLTVTGVAEGIASPSTSGRFLHKIASCKVIFNGDTVHSFPTSLGKIGTDDTGFSAVPFKTKLAPPVDAWDTEKPGFPWTSGSGMWRGLQDTYNGATGSASFTGTAANQNGICMPLDGGAPGVYHVTGQVHLGGCSASEGVNTVRILSIVAMYPGDTTRYILASNMVSATGGPTSLQVSDLVSMRDAGTCLFLAVRHNCAADVVLNPPIGYQYSGGAWSTSNDGFKATFAVTYLGSRDF